MKIHRILIYSISLEIKNNLVCAVHYHHQGVRPAQGFHPYFQRAPEDMSSGLEIESEVCFLPLQLSVDIDTGAARLGSDPHFTGLLRWRRGGKTETVTSRRCLTGCNLHRVMTDLFPRTLILNSNNAGTGVQHCLGSVFVSGQKLTVDIDIS